MSLIDKFDLFLFKYRLFFVVIFTETRFCEGILIIVRELKLLEKDKISRASSNRFIAIWSFRMKER